MTRIHYFVGIFLLALMVTAGTTFAQPGPGGDRPGGPAVAGGPDGGNGPQRGLGGILPPRVVLVRILRLTDEQLEQVQALVQEIQDTLGPIHEQIAILREELRAELEMETPDPMVVGEIVIAIHDLKVEAANLREQFREQFLGILTEEQRARLQAFIDAHSRRGDDETEEEDEV